METTKRISTIETEMNDIVVKLIVTETGYSIKIVKVFGRPIIHPIIALIKNISGPNTVDALFDRCQSAIKIQHNLKPRKDGSESITDIIVDGKHGVTISRRYDSEFVVNTIDNMIRITNIDNEIIISYYYDMIISLLRSKVVYTYDQNNEPIAISKEVY